MFLFRDLNENITLRKFQFMHISNRYIQSFLVFLVLLGGLFIASCEKDITVSLPRPDDMIVVEGVIESGQTPWVILTRNAAYFDKVDITTLGKLIIQDARVTITDGTITDTLKFDINPNIFPFVRYIGKKIIGVEGREYTLNIEVDGKQIISKTTIPKSIPIDSLVFKLEKPFEADSLGYVWLNFKDPENEPNYYRFYTKKLGIDSVFMHPFSSIIEDELINGQVIQYPLYHGRNFNQTGADTVETEEGPKRYMFKAGDKVVIKLTTMDASHFKFWSSFEQQLSSGGNPFAAPATVLSNIEGALGIWGGYGVQYDTIFIQMPPTK